jgi:sulfate adenylyltransferase subunit 1 (EFTu-like GTPase family)
MQEPRRVTSLHVGDRPVQQAEVPLSVALELEPRTGLARGQMLARPANLPRIGTELDATVCWMDRRPLAPGASFTVQHTTRRTACVVERIHYRIDIDTLHRVQADSLQLNDIGRVRLRTQEPVMFDAYRQNRTTGSLILIDPATGATSGAAMLR